MKHVSGLVVELTLFFSLLCSCEDLNSQGHEVSEEYVEIPFSVKISADVSNYPLSKVDSETDDFIYAVEVKEKTSTSEVAVDYAYGFFTSLDGISIRMNKEKIYEIYVVVIYNYFSSGYSFHVLKNSDGQDFINYTEANNTIVYVNKEKLLGLDAWFNRGGKHVNVIKCDTFSNYIGYFDPNRFSSVSLLLKRTASMITTTIINSPDFTEGSIDIYVDEDILVHSLVPDRLEESTFIGVKSFVIGETIYDTIPIKAVYNSPNGRRTVFYESQTGERLERNNQLIIRVQLSKKTSGQNFSITWDKDSRIEAGGLLKIIGSY